MPIIDRQIIQKGILHSKNHPFYAILPRETMTKIDLFFNGERWNLMNKANFCQSSKIKNTKTSAEKVQFSSQNPPFSIKNRIFPMERAEFSHKTIEKLPISHQKLQQKHHILCQKFTSYTTNPQRHKNIVKPPLFYYNFWETNSPKFSMEEERISPTQI